MHSEVSHGQGTSTIINVINLEWYLLTDISSGLQFEHGIRMKVLATPGLKRSLAAYRKAPNISRVPFPTTPRVNTSVSECNLSDQTRQGGPLKYEIKITTQQSF